MSIALSLKDTFYPYEGYDHERKIARAIVMDDKGDFAIHHLHRVDIFGDVRYPETPGGGVDEGESYEDACLFSLHGKNTEKDYRILADKVLYNRKVFVLLSGAEDVSVAAKDFWI